MAKAKYNPNEVAAEIARTARELGWTFSVRNGSILVINKIIPAGDKDAFSVADGEYYSILGKLPTTSPGSTWGTDGGGVGALSAMNSGVFTMHKSGGAKRVLTALAKLS